MHHVLITTTYTNQNTEATSVSTVLVACASDAEAQAIVQGVWNQCNGGNAAPNGITHDAIIIGAPVEIPSSIELAELREKVKYLESMRPHWAQGYTSDGQAASAATGALAQIWGLLGVKHQTDAVIRVRSLLVDEHNAANPS